MCCLILAGCASSPAVHHQPEERLPVVSKEGSAFYYQCDKDFGFPAHGTEDAITVDLKDGSHTLRRNSVEAGFHYSQGKISLQGKGDQAYFNDGSQRYQCVIDRRKSLWEDARYRGADFIAMGNEPGWKLELSRQGDMLYIGDYGTVSFRIATPKSSHANKSPLVFAAKDAEHSLWLSIEDKPCVDTMKGDRFDVSVSLVVDGRPLTGCGMILNPLYP
ncbi:hypothetical protein GZ77_20375 [Endozoicomonas montiporae]|uniref:C-type lysozyme inhibitor domain-containing protein n=2 Tax=Endozoicomonas montiporae TaxID=1027273 RepID=A0A081N2Z0_9GAMM|nr:hypothetical protein GZ77_20375 [Endozoicomonas montiporae]